MLTSPTHYLFHLRRHGLLFLACSRLELPPLLPLHFLSRLAALLSDYLGPLPLCDDLVKDNFVLVYQAGPSSLIIPLPPLLTHLLTHNSHHMQLLDEAMDNGFPLATDPDLLHAIVPPPSFVSKVLSAVTGKPSPALSPAAASPLPWRSPHPNNTTNDLYVNLLEHLDASVARSVFFLSFSALVLTAI